MKTLIKYAVLPLLLASTPLLTYADNKSSEKNFSVKLFPLNGSGVSGKAKIKIKKNKILKVSIKAEGLEINKPHPQHIHGLADTSIVATCPDISADVNADGLISVGEGFPFYGPIVLPLNPFDLVESDGSLRYKASYSINPDSIQPIGKRTIVLHGMTVNGEYIASLPVACGQIELDNDKD